MCVTTTPLIHIALLQECSTENTSHLLCVVSSIIPTIEKRSRVLFLRNGSNRPQYRFAPTITGKLTPTYHRSTFARIRAGLAAPQTCLGLGQGWQPLKPPNVRPTCHPPYVGNVPSARIGLGHLVHLKNRPNPLQPQPRASCQHLGDPSNPNMPGWQPVSKPLTLVSPMRCRLANPLEFIQTSTGDVKWP